MTKETGKKGEGETLNKDVDAVKKVQIKGEKRTQIWKQVDEEGRGEKWKRKVGKKIPKQEDKCSEEMCKGREQEMQKEEKPDAVKRDAEKRGK